MKKRGEIEVSPLAFMRGRTFSNTFLIVDEAQNSTIKEIKTVLTRLGQGCKCFVFHTVRIPYLLKNENAR